MIGAGAAIKGVVTGEAIEDVGFTEAVEGVSGGGADEAITVFSAVAAGADANGEGGVIVGGGDAVCDGECEINGADEIGGWREGPAVGGIAGEGACGGVDEGEGGDGEGVSLNVGVTGEQVCGGEGEGLGCRSTG